MVRPALALLRRDLALSARAGGGAGLGLAFFLVIAAFIPFGVGKAPELLARIAPGMVWIGALLSCLLTLDRLFQADIEDGSMDLIALAPLPLEAATLAKCAAHWLTTGLPLTLAALPVGLMLRLPEAAYPALLFSLLIGTPALSLIGAIGAALTAGLRRGGLLTSVLVMPLYIPTLIFGALAVRAAADGFDPAPHLMMLGALTLLSLVIAPVAAAAALRLHLE